MSSHYQVQVLPFQKIGNNISPKNKRDPAIILSPTLIMCLLMCEFHANKSGSSNNLALVARTYSSFRVRIAPQQVTHKPQIWDITWSLQFGNLLQRLQFR